MAELLATALFLTLASLGLGPKAISWGVSYALSTLLAGPQAVLNPALSLAMVASRQVKTYTILFGFGVYLSFCLLSIPF